MTSVHSDIESRFVNALRSQTAPNSTVLRSSIPLPCPWCHNGQTYQNSDRLLKHVRYEHRSLTEGLGDVWARATLEAAVRKSSDTVRSMGDTLVPDLSALSLDSEKERHTSPSSGKKRRAESEIRARQGKMPSHIEIADLEYSRGTSRKVSPETARAWPTSGTPRLNPDCQRTPPSQSFRPGIVEQQKFDPRYPGLLLQPDSRPISQEQLASEVKSIYAGLTMVENKCIHVDRAQSAATSEANSRLTPDHWQALVDLHCTLLHEHHDFFLTMQQPANSTASNLLAMKYKMPARDWKDRMLIPDTMAATQKPSVLSDFLRIFGTYSNLGHYDILVNLLKHKLILGWIEDPEEVQHTPLVCVDHQEAIKAKLSTRGTNRYEIPSVVKGRGRQLEVNALGDTCATKNFISPDCVAELGLPIDKSHSTLVRVASGDEVRTEGVIRTAFHFRDEPDTEYPLLFHVLPNVVQDLILGKKFLNLTKTFRSKANRLRRVKERFVNTLKQHHVLYLGDDGPRFTGLLNGRAVQALADTGSDVLVMDEDFAIASGFPIHRGPKHCERLVFADGSTKMTAGMAYNVEWRFGDDDEIHVLNFHVLKKAPAPIILSASFLIDTDAYDEYDCYLIDDDDDNDDDTDDDTDDVDDERGTFFFCIKSSSNYDAQGKIDKFSIATQEHEEQGRRNRAEDELSTLRGRARDIALDRETERRSAFDRSIQALRDQQAASSELVAAIPALDPPVGLPPDPPAPASEKEKWYRFRLKRRKKPDALPMETMPAAIAPI